MLKQDQKGYVLSAIGMLLMIPIILIIPIALSTQEQASNSTDIFTKTDVSFRTVKNVIEDMNKQANTFIQIDSTVFREDQSSNLAGNLTTLFNKTKPINYQNSYAFTVDELTIEPDYSNIGSSMNNETGYINTNQGIKFKYEGLGTPYYALEGTGSNRAYYYNYTANLTININIEAKKLNSGYQQKIDRYYTLFFRINTRTSDAGEAATRVNNFFNNLKSGLNSYY